jgi:hypothetical protein
VADSDDQNDQGVVEEVINDPVVADAHSVRGFLAFELDCIARTGLDLQIVQALEKAGLN